jgi:cytochrome c-type biogenesis protein
MALFSEIFTSFVLGLLTPIGAVCVLPLYPGFLAYLANKLSPKTEKKTFIYLGSLVVLGVITFMLLLGLVFTTFLQVSLTNVVGIVSPIAFFILAVISLLLIFDVDVGRFLPQIQSPSVKNPLLSAFAYGFFFGAIVIPCNPSFIAILFTRSLLMSNFFVNIMNFLFFGFGIGFPLLLLSLVSASRGQQLIDFLTKYKRKINLIAGIIMLSISIYYLVFVFRIIG